MYTSRGGKNDALIVLGCEVLLVSPPITLLLLLLAQGAIYRQDGIL